MALTRKFKQTILDRAASDPKFRKQMLVEAINEMLAGDLEAGKSMLRDYIHATITFEGLAEKIGKSSKSIHRMLGPSMTVKVAADAGETAEIVKNIIMLKQQREIAILFMSTSPN